MLSIKPLSETIGAEIQDLDLSKGLTKEQSKEVLKTFLKYQVLVFRNQHLTPEQYIQFGRYFGELEPFFLSEYNLPEYPNIYVLSNVKKNGKFIGRYGAGMHWHSDHTYQEAPASATFLYAIEVPPEGGDTLFINNYLSYENLSEHRKRQLDGLKAIHHYQTQEHLYTAEDNLSEQMRRKIIDHLETVQTSTQPKKQVPDVLHPIVRTHPVTGRKALYLNEAMTIGIEGMSPQEGHKLLQELCTETVKTVPIYRHKWQVGDVVVWDNPSVMHSGTYTDPKYPRIMYRLTTQGTKTF
jgi:taurine dioxygenase